MPSKWNWSTYGWQIQEGGQRMPVWSTKLQNLSVSVDLATVDNLFLCFWVFSITKCYLIINLNQSLPVSAFQTWFWKPWQWQNFLPNWQSLFLLMTNFMDDPRWQPIKHVNMCVCLCVYMYRQKHQGCVWQRKEVNNRLHSSKCWPCAEVDPTDPLVCEICSLEASRVVAVVEAVTALEK